MLSTLIKRFWKEISIALLVIISYLGWKRDPGIIEVTKTEYVDRVVEVEKIVTVEKNTTSNKKKRTTVQKPDGTKIITETVENKNTDEKVKENEKIDTKETIKTQTQIRNAYSLNLAYTHYKEQTISVSYNFRLGQLPILVGPHVIYNLETKSAGIGLNLQFEI
jgi:hypothetical protein